MLFLLGNDWFYSFNCNFSLFSFISHKKVVPLQQDKTSSETLCQKLANSLDGKAPSKVIAKVNEWMDLHEAEILTLWEKAQKGEKLGRIEPLR